MQEITIGIMIPTSGILPMGKQFDKAFKKAIKLELSNTDCELEIITEMIGQGNPVMIEKSLDKFFGYHDVNLVTGLFTNHAMGSFVDKFEKRKVPLIINNLGEHLIPSKGYNSQVLINSTHLWQHCWAMGQYAAQNLGKKGLILSSMFDAGYAFLNCIQLGLYSEDENFDHDLRLLPLPQPGKLSQVKEAFDNIDMSEYDFVFPLFCGEEATIFLEEFHSRELMSKTKLIGLPYLLELKEKDLSGLELISTAHENQPKGDLLWKGIFETMGKNCGRAVGRVIAKNLENIDAEELIKEMSAIDGGKEYDSTKIPCLNEKIRLVRHKVKAGNQVVSEDIISVDIDLKNDEKIRQSRDAISSSWMNSYLAV
tara:strand:+ start:4398 stop:5501 length:1104 start_codon:yes stop_codon:yes gene_type:complete